MKNEGLYQHGMYGDRDSMGKKAVHKKMGEYFPQQSSQLTEDGMAIDASRTPGMEMYEAGMAQVSEEEPNPNQAKRGKIYTDEQISSMSDKKKIRKGLAPGVEGDEHTPSDPTKYKYKFDLKGNIKPEVATDLEGNQINMGNQMRARNSNFTIGGNPESGGASGGMGFGSINAELPKVNIGGLGIGSKIKENRLARNSGVGRNKSHYLKKGNRFSAGKTTKRHKKGF